MSDGRTRPWCIPGWELECGLGIYLLCSCYYTTTAGAASAPAATISTTPWENGRWVCEPWFRWTCWIVFWQCDFYLFFCYFWTIPPLLPRDIKRFAANFKFHNQNIWRVFVFEGADEAFLDTNIYNIIQYIPNRTPHFKHLSKCDELIEVFTKLTIEAFRSNGWPRCPEEPFTSLLYGTYHSIAVQVGFRCRAAESKA